MARPSRADYQRDWRARNPKKAYEYVKAWKAKHPEQARKMKKEADRKFRQNHPEQIAEGKKRWQFEHPEQHKKTRSEISRRYRRNHQAEVIDYAMQWAEENPEKVIAKKMAANLPYEPLCEFCPNTKNLQHHHPDYSEPLFVVTACASCHKYAEESQIAINPLSLTELIA